LAREEVFTLTRAAGNAPEKHAANVACNLKWVAREAVGGGADLAEVAVGGQREDAEVFDLLGIMSVTVKECVRQQDLRQVLP
jgi:hypothetical protein